ncbi:MAG: exodeoxyribonuclease V subunit beta [Myxococcota bacterium]
MKPFAAGDVDTTKGFLVEASAGTGKTYAITTLLVRLVASGAYSIDQILVVTFTEAATAELRRRIRNRLVTAAKGGDPEVPLDAEARANLSAAVLQLDAAAVFTLHGFCHRVLVDGAFESGRRFDLELSADTDGIVADILHDHLGARLRELDSEEHAALVAEKFTPSPLMALLRATASRPEMPIVPAADHDPEPPAPPDVATLVATLASHWSRDRVETALGDTQKNPPAVAKRIDRVAHALAEGREPPSDALGRFSSAEIGRNTKKGHRVADDPFFGAVDRHLEAMERVAPYWAWRYREEVRALVSVGRRALPERLAAAGRLSFDGLLRTVQDALDGPRGARLAAWIRARYPVALVDEFQDTDPVQYGIIRRIWSRDEAMLIGDPKQAIYAFRGADIFAYLEAARRTEASRRYTMAMNWRSDPGLVRGVNAVFARAAPFAMEGVGFVDVTPRPGAVDRFVDLEHPAPVQLLWRRDPEADSTEGTAALVLELLTGGARLESSPVRPDDIAVLTRSNDQAFRVQAALRRIGVPTVVTGHASVFAHEPAEALLALLAATLEPGDDRRVRASLWSPLFEVGPRDLHAMATDEDETQGEAYEDWVGRFRDWHATWLARGVHVMLERVFRERDVMARLLRRPDGERWGADLAHLGELLHAAERADHLGPAGTYQHLAAQCRDAPTDERALRRLETDRAAVRINTVHKAKGLEYRIVICPFLDTSAELRGSDRNRPSYHDDEGRRVLDLAPDAEALKRAGQERLSEELRLAYVAMTRAAHRLYVVCDPASAAYRQSALAYLLHLRGCPDVRDPGAFNLSSDGLRADVEALAASSGGGVGVIDWRSPAPRGRYVDATAAVLPLTLPTPPRRPTAWRTASFSHLAGGRGGPGPTEGREDDESGAGPGSGETSVAASDGERVALHEFPRGPRAGNFFHHVLEGLDFTDPEALGPRVRATLADYDFAPRWAEPVTQALGEVIRTPLDDHRNGLALASVALHDRRDELPFVLPVGTSLGRPPPAPRVQLSLTFGAAAPSSGGGFPSGGEGFTATALGEVFRDVPSAGYAERVARLPFAPLRGFLKGYIDLVCRHRERFYIIDYKSNHLGDAWTDYAAAALPDAMAHGHYYLQYHLYALAVHRWLQSRQPGYDYERHFGGVYYLFLKGMRTRTGRHFGVFFDRPPRRRIDALEALFGFTTT